MVIFVVIVAAAAVAGGVLVFSRPRRRRGDRSAYELGQVVLEAYGEDWATRLGQPPAMVRPAVLGTGAPALRRALDQLIGQVEVDFGGAGGAGTTVPVTVTVAYRDDRTQSRAQMMLPWDMVPTAVRAELIRGRTEVSLTWRPVPEFPPPAEPAR